MKVIFLDFNGVLDTWDEMDKINPDNLQRLKKIAFTCGAKIVISSSLKNSYWYLGHMSNMLKLLVDTLENEGMEVVGFTPFGKDREEEILTFLKEHQEIEEYVILEDDYDMPKLSNHLVKLPSQMIGESQRGLEDIHVKLAINILGAKGKSLLNIRKENNYDNS